MSSKFLYFFRYYFFFSSSSKPTIIALLSSLLFEMRALTLNQVTRYRKRLCSPPNQSQKIALQKEKLLEEQAQARSSKQLSNCPLGLKPLQPAGRGRMAANDDFFWAKKFQKKFLSD